MLRNYPNMGSQNIKNRQKKSSPGCFYNDMQVIILLTAFGKLRFYLQHKHILPLGLGSILDSNYRKSSSSLSE